MGAKFRYEDYAAQLRKDGKIAEQVVEVIRRTVKLHGPRAVQDEISDLARAPVDRGTYRRSFRFDDIPNGAVAYNFAPYAAVIEGGRRPGARMPPLASIMDWVRRKGIGRKSGPNQTGKRKVTRKLTDSEVRGIAYVIARAIKAKGIPAHHILERAAEVIDVEIRREIDAFLRGRRA